MNPPTTFPAPVADYLMYLLRPVAGSLSTKCLLSIGGHLDEDRLRRAVRLSFEAEPILGCRLVEHWSRPIWQRRADLDDLPLCNVVRCSEAGPSVARFLLDPIDPTRDPLVRVAVFRGETDTVGVKITHAVADGPSTNSYVHLLLQLYRRLKHEPSYRPEPNPSGSRNMLEVVSGVSLREKLKALRRLRASRDCNRGQADWLPPPVSGDGSRRGYLFMKLPADRIQQLKEYGWERSATITAVMLTGFYRALLTLARPLNEDLARVGSWIDVRRFLPPQRRSTTPGNISSEITFSVAGLRNASFDQVMSNLMDQLRQSVLDPCRAIIPVALVNGLLCGRVLSFVEYRLLRRFFASQADKVLHARKGVRAALTNLGTLAFAQDGPEEPPVVDAQLCGINLDLGGFVVTVSEFCETMTASLGFHDTILDEPTARRLLTEFDKALPGFSGVPADIVAVATGRSPSGPHALRPHLGAGTGREAQAIPR
jgi:NRPS condensation-like uncharacterized protein